MVIRHNRGDISICSRPNKLNHSSFSGSYDLSTILSKGFYKALPFKLAV